MSDPGRLQGARVDYRVRRICEAAGGLQIPLDLIASIDEAIDDVCALGDEGVASDEILRLTPYFGTLWPSARGLARWLGEHPTWLRGQTVLELGCGLALPALVAARLGARVVAVDRHPDVRPFLARNTALSQVAIEHLQVDWSDHDELGALQRRLGAIDLVVGSDLLYEGELAASLPLAVDALCGGGARMLLADPGRPHLQAAITALERRGFTSRLEIRAVPGTLDDTGVDGGTGRTQEVFLFELVRAAATSGGAPLTA